MSNMTPDVHAFHMKEVDYLRKEIEYRTLDQSKIERDVVIAVSLIYTALATQVDRVVPALAPLRFYFWIIPFLVVAMAWTKFLANHYAITNIGIYIVKLENDFDPKGLGWQSWINSHPQAGNKIPSRIRWLSWPALILLTIVIPMVVYFL